MNSPQNHPQPSAQWIASVILDFARRRFFIQTWPGVKPLWSCHLQHPKLGGQVFVELMPSLALRVRDRKTGETLAQSLPGAFEVLDATAPSIEKAFEAWQQSRETAPVVAAAPVEQHPTTNPNPNPGGDL